MDSTLKNLLFAMQQKNLLYNGDFRYFSNQVPNGGVINYGIPDGWLYADSGRNGKIGFDAGTSCCIITKSEGNERMVFSQMLHEFPRWKEMIANQLVTAKVVLSVSTGSTITAKLTDGIDTSAVSKTGNGNFEFDVQLFVNNDAKKLCLSIESETPFVKIAVLQVYANVGEFALKNLPGTVSGIIGERKQYVATETAPAEELSLCAAPVELGEDYTRLNSVLNGRFGTGPAKRSLLPDMRGYFSRSWNNGSAMDPDAKDRKALGGTITGDHVGTTEPDVFKKHDHKLKFATDKPILVGDKVSATIINTMSTSKTDPEGGSETRPVNISELYTIKWA